MLEPAHNALVSARVKLLFEKPEIGRLAARLVFVDATDTIETVEVDGLRLAYNRDYVCGLHPAETVTLLERAVG